MRHRIAVLVALIAVAALVGPTLAGAEQASRPNGSEKPSDQRAAKKDERPHVKLGCRPLEAREADEDEPAEPAAVACQWSRSDSRQFKSYRLYRGERESEMKVIFRTTRRAQTQFTDEKVKPGTKYHYRLDVVGSRSRVIAKSNVVPVRCCEVPKQPPADRPALHLGCRAGQGEETPVVGCMWSKSEDEKFGGYRLMRKEQDGEPTAVFSSRERDATFFADRDVRDGAVYNYGVEVLDTDGKTIGHSNRFAVKCCNPENGPRPEARPEDKPRPEDRPKPEPRPEASPAMRLGCHAERVEGTPVVGCVWSRSEDPKFASYKLERRVNRSEPAVIHTSSERDATKFADRDVKEGDAYQYAASALDANGQTIARSPIVDVKIGGDDGGTVSVRLHCESASGDPAIGCMWAASDSAQFGGYQLHRKSEDGARVVFATRDRNVNRYLDREVRAGATYSYVLEVLDQNGKVIGRSPAVTVKAGGGEPRP